MIASVILECSDCYIKAFRAGTAFSSWKVLAPATVIIQDTET